MAAVSAGILLYRSVDSETEVLLVHPGGPFWAKKNEAAWSIPKGLVDPGEDHLDAAKRELFEETGVTLSSEPRLLGTYKQPGSKSVEVWVAKADGSEEPDPSVSSQFDIEWPPHSGKREFFPEVDRAEWFVLEEAALALHKGQVAMLDDLRRFLSE
ncbi:NUDIX domain-containing protein [Rhizobium sp. Rhizsp42]|uniref:NUDIX domain-containing protein n=1 Tax=Rhizobium sp. Rhizsp42 TaxID=3243034 RepID=UPI0039AF71CE